MTVVSNESCCHIRGRRGGVIIMGVIAAVASFRRRTPGTGGKECDSMGV